MNNLGLILVGRHLGIFARIVISFKVKAIIIVLWVYNVTSIIAIIAITVQVRVVVRIIIMIGIGIGIGIMMIICRVRY